jgi:hypothetical protein
MGGWNSGRNYRGAGRCESWHRVELGYLRKHTISSAPVQAGRSLGIEAASIPAASAFTRSTDTPSSATAAMVKTSSSASITAIRRRISAAGAFGSNVRTATGLHAMPPS